MITRSFTSKNCKPKGKKRKQIQEKEEQTNYYIEKPKGKKRKQQKDEEQTNYYIRKHVEKPKGKKRKQQEEEEEQTTTYIGDVVNLSDLLFTDTRDYLIKYKDNQRVKDKQLAGKVVVLLFVSLVNGYKYWKSYSADLLDIYNKLEPKGGFEVIFVAVTDARPCYYDTGESTSTYSTPRGRFKQCFSTMPWTAIPFSDSKSRKRLERKFGAFKDCQVDFYPVSFVIDPRGLVVQYDARTLFSRYGVAGFPFTNERIEWLDYEDNVARMQLSIKTLLASPERDYVITNKGKQVPLHKLKNKVVGLFFFADSLGKCITRKLKMAYEELSKNVKNFEVVLINLLPISSDKCEDALWKTFEAMPWLAIPFRDTDCSKKLLRIFEDIICDHGLDLVSKLVIIGPHGKFIEPFGAHIMMHYGIPAYPFTRSSAVNLEIKRAENVKPEMLWNLDSVFRQQNGCQVRFSQIVGKRIIVLFEGYDGSTSEHTLNKLKALYIQMKGTDDEFEVIHIHKGGEFECVAPGVPWLTHPPFDMASDAEQVAARFFGSIWFGFGLVAFDRDGTVVRMTPCPAIGKMVFPFYECDVMEDEVMWLVQNIIGEPLETLSCCW